MLDLWPWTESERAEAARRERIVQRKQGACIHFDGYLGNTNATCRAGVRIDSVILTNPDGWPPTELTRVAGMTIPCCQSLPCKAVLNPAGATCAQRELHTREQAVAALSGDEERAEDRRQRGR